MVAKKPPEPETFAFLQPLHWKVWFIIIGCCKIIALLCAYVEYVTPSKPTSSNQQVFLIKWHRPERWKFNKILTSLKKSALNLLERFVLEKIHMKRFVKIFD